MFYPLFGMVALTTFVFALNLVLRIWSAATGKVNPRHFKLYNTDCEVPEFLEAGTRHMANLFETPVLFYVAGVLTIVRHAENALIVNLAWGYVGLRALHAFIHMTYNHVIHRMLTFLVSFLVLVFMWVHLLLHHVHS
jgi:hypothetical protein